MQVLNTRDRAPQHPVRVPGYVGHGTRETAAKVGELIQPPECPGVHLVDTAGIVRAWRGGGGSGTYGPTHFLYFLKTFSYRLISVFVICPHCQGEVELHVTLPASAPRHSTFASADPHQIVNGHGYQPNPSKAYKTPESSRRERLAYYYRNREDILAKAKDKRRKQKAQLQETR